jgi:hypothetical protein
MEQLVHLRLKSIYKAFQQSSPSKKQTKFAAAAAAAACGKEVAVVASASSASASSASASATTRKGAHHEKTFSARQAQADAAAAALLAELEEEEQDKKKKTLKKKKKKAKSREKEEGTILIPVQGGEKAPPSSEGTEDDDDDDAEHVLVNEVQEEDDDEPRHYDSSPPPEEKMDPEEARFCEMVVDNDAQGIEALLAELKGVPGKAALRKNAKKALKRFRQEQEEKIVLEEEEEEERGGITPPPPPPLASSSSSYKPPEPLLTLVSRNIHSSTKSECVLHMSPTVVGWVIGKGGQRIRDLMDESGSKVWIDQDSMGQQDPRVVYVSGPAKSVDDAVSRLKDLVAKAPVGGGSSMTTTTTTVVSTSQQSSDGVPPKLSSSSSPGLVLARSASLGGAKKAPPPPYAATLSSSPAKDWTVQDVTCEARFVPLLIGRRGWTIKHIQDSSGARVDIDQSVTPRRIRISGKKDSVASAVRMVKDVLSYPHAQLASSAAAAQDNVGLDDDVAAADGGGGTHSPPPSSLIMTRDIKGTVSATSSLSSTPEPSMASLGSNYKHPGPTGAMILPNVSLPILQTSFGESTLGEFSHPREPPPPHAMSSGVVSDAAAQLFPTTANDAVPQQQTPEAHFASLRSAAYGLTPPYEQAHQDAPFARGGGMPFGQHHQQHHPNPTPFGGTSAFGHAQQNAPPYGLQQQQLIGHPPTSDGMRHDPIGQPLPQSRPPFSADSYQPAHLLFQRSESENDRGRIPPGNFNEVEPLLPDLWGKGNQVSAHNNMDHSPAYLFQGQRLPHRQNSDSAIPPHLYSDSRLARRNSMPESSMMRESSVPAAHPPGLAGACEDSNLVDSLFGPPGGGDQNLLSGLQGLSLDNNDLGWRSSIAGWGNDNDKNDQAQRSEQSSALPAGLLGSSQQQQQQSRFDWG